MASPTSHASSLVQVYISPELARYGFGQGHPLGSGRMDVFWHEGIKQGTDKRVSIVDSIAGDPITHMRFSPAAHAHASVSHCCITDEYCQGA
ncbi:MAG: hypothetical protein Q9M82_02210 [Mariprofundus sp.]|nr:hypothetical protein [Mariprofundus sp.]